MQIKTTMRYHLTDIRMAIMKKGKRKERVGKEVESWSSCALLVGMTNGTANSMTLPQIITQRLTIQSRNSTSGYIPKRIESRDLDRYLYTLVQSNVFHHSQKR